MPEQINGGIDAITAHKQLLALETKELRHDNLMISIKSEIETLKSLGISPLNFQESTYVNPRGKVYPCFILNDESMLKLKS